MVSFKSEPDTHLWDESDAPFKPPSIATLTGLLLLYKLLWISWPVNIPLVPWIKLILEYGLGLVSSHWIKIVLPRWVFIIDVFKSPFSKLNLFHYDL